MGYSETGSGEDDLTDIIERLKLPRAGCGRVSANQVSLLPSSKSSVVVDDLLASKFLGAFLGAF